MYGKKFISILLCVLMVMSVIPVMPTSTAQAAGPGQVDVVVFTKDQTNNDTGLFSDVAKHPTTGALAAVCYWNNTHAPYYFDYNAESQTEVENQKKLGKIKIAFDDDGDGLNWSEPQELITPQKLCDWGIGVWADKSGKVYYTRTEADDASAIPATEARDPGVVTMPDGTLLLTFFTRMPAGTTMHGVTTSTTDSGTYYGGGFAYIMYSKDMGKNWSNPERIPSSFFTKTTAKRGTIACYNDGQIMIPLYAGAYDGETLLGSAISCVLARLDDNGNWVWDGEYADDAVLTGDVTDATTGAIGEKLGAFAKGATEAAFGATTLNGQEVTYALYRPQGDFLISYDRGKSWTVLGRDVERGFAFNNPIRFQQPTFSRISVNNKENDKGELFITYSGSGINGGRSVFGKIYTPGEDWGDTDYTLLYENPAGYDMADPTGIELNNGKLFTLVYDVTAGFVGGVFHDYDDVKNGEEYDAQELPANILTENFESYEALDAGTYNSSNPYTESLVYGSSAARSATRADGNNKYLEMAPAANANGTLGWNYFSPKPRVSGDALVQFDFKFNDSAAENAQQMLRMYFAASGDGEYDSFYITLHQNDGTGDVGRLTTNFNEAVKKSVDGVFTAGKFYTMKIYRQGDTIFIKVWEKGTDEPSEFTVTHKFAALKTNGYPGFWYGSTMSDMSLCIDNIIINQTNTLTLSQNSANISEPFKLTATLAPAVEGAQIKWSSSNTAVATVAQDGTVTPVAPGSAVITASYNNVIDTCSVLIDSVHDELAAVKPAIKLIDETFNDSTGTTYAVPASGVITGNVSGRTLYTDSATGNKYIALSIGNANCQRNLITAGGNYTFQYDFYVDAVTASGAWSDISIVFGNQTTYSSGSDKAFIRLKQNTDSYSGVPFVKITDGGGVNDLSVYYNGASVATKQEYQNAFSANVWNTLKLIKIDDTVYMKIWNRSEAEPSGYTYKMSGTANFKFDNIGIRQQRSGDNGKHTYIDNIILSKHVDFSIVDDGSTALKAVFDRDISAETPAPTVTWNSSDAEVVSVDNGTLSYLKEGNAKITASSYNLSDELDVTVAKLTYNMNGHGTQIEPQLFRGGTALTAPADPSADGYVFMGWYTDAAFSTKFDFANPGSESVTLYARWVTDAPTDGTPYGGTAPVIAAEGTTVISAREKNVDAIGSGGSYTENDGYNDIRSTVSGEWWTYTVNVAKAGYYKLATLGSSGYHHTNGRFTLAIDGKTITDGTGENAVVLPQNGDYPWDQTDTVKAWYYFDDTDKTDIGVVYLSEGEHVMKVTVDVHSGDFIGTCFKKFYFTPATDAEVAGTPYGGTAPEIAAYGMTTIYAARVNENSAGGGIIADTMGAGYNVADNPEYMDIRSKVAGESWFYTVNVSKAGTYVLEALATSGYGATNATDNGGRFSLTIDGNTVVDGTGENAVVLPAWGDGTNFGADKKAWHEFTFADRTSLGTVNLSEGTHIIKVTVNQPGDNAHGVIFGKFYFTSIDSFKAVSHNIANSTAAVTLQGKASSDKMKAILAEYGEGGKLVKARVQDIALTDATEFTKTFDLTESGVTSRRLFIFDVAKLIPGLSTPYDVN